jgi:hypothetical protein
VIGSANRWLVGVLLFLMLATPTLSLAQDTVPEPPVVEDTTPVEAEAPPVDEGVEPPPVETPVPQEPAPEIPTSEPVATDEPTIPAPTVAVTTEPDPTVTPDTATIEPLVYGPANVVATNGSCVLASAMDIVEIGEVVAIRCANSVDGDWTFAVDSLSAGWLWAFRYGVSAALPTSEEIAAWPMGADGTGATQMGWTQAAGTFGAPVTIENASDLRTVEFFLTPTAAALPATSAGLNITLAPFVAIEDAGLAEESLVAPMMVVADGPSGCAQLSATDVVSFPAAGVRDYVMYKCTWPGTEWQLRVDGITASGWEWAAISGGLAPAQIESNPPSIATIGGWSSGAPTWVTGFAANAPACPFASKALAGGTSAGNDLNAYYLFLKPRGGGLPGTHGDITIRQIPAALGPVCAGEAPTPTGSRTSTVTGILAGSNALTCTQVSPAGSTVAPPDFFRFRCDAGPGNTNQVFIDRISTGWSWRVLAPVGGQIVTVKEGTTPDVYTGSQRPWNAESSAWYVDLIPTSSAAAGSEGHVFVRLTGNYPSARAVTARLGGSRTDGTAAPATANDVQLSCATSAIQALVASPVTVDCTWSARPSLGNREVTLENITIPAPTGWTPSTSAANATVQGGVLSIAPGMTISNQGTGYAFSFSLLPSCDATTIPTPTTVSSRFVTTSGPVDGPTATLSAARLPGSLAVNVIDAQTSLDWNLDYQFAAQAVDGTLAYRVVSSQCGGWSIQVQASAFSYSGPYEGPGIPAANIAVASADAPIPAGGNVNGITVPPSGAGTLAAPVTILNASPGAGAGSYENQLDLRVTIPAFAPPGDYLSTITITSSVGP